MSFLIDGYNFLFRIEGQKEKSLEEKREAFICTLNRELACFKASISLIFDSAEQQREYAQCAHLQNLDILYAPKGKTADEYIIELVEISKSPKTLTVVTSDGGLSRQCQQMGAKTLSIEAFVVIIVKKGKEPCRGKPCYRESPSQLERLLKIFEEKLRGD